MCVEIYTDASFMKEGLSTHHYRVRVNKKNKNRRTFSGYESTSMKSEIESITRALQKVLKKDWRGAKIYTDSLEVVRKVYNSDDESHDYNYIRHVLKNTRSKLIYKPRETKGIKIADRECRKLMQTRLRREDVLN